MKRRWLGFCIWLFFILMSLFSLSESRAEVTEIHLKSGKILRGEILKKSSECLQVNVQGVAVTFFSDEILKVQPAQLEPVSVNSPLDISLPESADQGLASVDPPGSIPGSAATLGSPRVYRIKKKFDFQFLTEVATFQFTFPLMRRDIARQQVSNIQTFPQTAALVDDPDGNKIAVFYFANKKQRESVTVEINYQVAMTPVDWQIDPAKAVHYGKLAPDIACFLVNEKLALHEEKFFSGELKTILRGAETPYLQAKAIYDYIVTNIRYESEEHLSGLQKPTETLFKKRGNCADIAKLYMALSRAAGIPTRQVDGVVFEPNISSTKSQLKVGHAWVEIYLPVYGWVPVDPTFGIAERGKYFCFVYQNHISECYGQVISRELGSLYRGSALEVRTPVASSGAPVRKSAFIEIELLKGK